MAKDEKVKTAVPCDGGSDSQLNGSSSDTQLRNLCGIMTHARISLEQQWTTARKIKPTQRTHAT